MTIKRSREDLELIAKIVKLVKENDLVEIDFKRKSETKDSIEIKISQKITLDPSDVVVASKSKITHSKLNEDAQDETLKEKLEPKADIAEHPGAILSPMVGTVYVSPEPGANPFVSIGDGVKTGQTILIIEAMKTLNQIPAPRDGIVKRILVEDGSPVEFESPLIIIE
tara:strand:+ start:79 stop:582 length:504 start_codon:yes stop_codon:yes gene_type:complete